MWALAVNRVGKLEIAKLVLEYLRVLLTAPFLFSVVVVIFIYRFAEDIKALLLRVAKIRLPGGTEVNTPQSSRIIEEEAKSPPKTMEVSDQGIPAGLTSEQAQAIKQLIRSHIANAYLWEYRYLNFFLVRSTQETLDWLIGLSQETTAYAYYDSVFLPIIPSANERQAIINALQMHHLVMYDESSNVIAVTPKGREYQEWRGTLPPLAKASARRS